MRPESDNVETLERTDIVRDFMVPGIWVDVFKMNTFREDTRLLSILVIGSWLLPEIGRFCELVEIDLISKVYRCVIKSRQRFQPKIRFWESWRMRVGSKAKYFSCFRNLSVCCCASPQLRSLDTGGGVVRSKLWCWNCDVRGPEYRAVVTELPMTAVLFSPPYPTEAGHTAH